MEKEFIKNSRVTLQKKVSKVRIYEATKAQISCHSYGPSVFRYSLSDRMTTQLVCSALSIAIQNQKPPQGLIVHRGSHRHDFATLIGPSGLGKSTLLNILGLLDTNTSG